KGAATPKQIQEAFPDQLTDPKGWGDGISTIFLETLAASGVDRACLILCDLKAGHSRPEIAKLADKLGYLYGPYDSYDTVHDPQAKETWETAQFDAELFKRGAVLREDGTPRPGFQGKGHLLNSQAARPYLEKRVRGMMREVPYTAWFMDCDAFGQFFDDFSPEHPATQGQDCA